MHSVRGLAPSIVASGEEFPISVRSEDFYYNRASGAVTEYRFSIDGKAYATIPAGDAAITR